MFSEILGNIIAGLIVLVIGKILDNIERGILR